MGLKAKKMSEEFMNRLLAWLTVMAAAVAGRLMHHAYQVQRGKRKFWSTALALDLIIAVGMGLVANGFCSFMEWSGAVQAGAIAVAGYLGPHIIEDAIKFYTTRGRRDAP